MSTSLQKKLRLKPGMRVLTINPPSDFKSILGTSESDITTGSTVKNFNQIHWFVKNRKDMQTDLKKVLGLLGEDIICWIYFPKGTSKIQTDLTRDTGWDEIQKQPGLTWLSLVSFDETWSTFAIRKATKSDEKKKSGTIEKPKEVLAYIDPVKKTVKIPEDLQAAFKKDKKAAVFFEGLAYSHRKEYVEWIITAKREETRVKRVEGTIERLNKSWKNPANN